ncbi:MAG: hypothetical protein IKW39_00045 [Alphaproteobacteria bacterium]|nr:hypothetical protein [Alphaproteobacteria bacterium]
MVKNYSQPDTDTKNKESILKSNNSFATFLILPYLIDRLYPEDEIYEDDVTYFLSQVYPKTDIKKLDYLADVFRAFVISKREYKKLIQVFKQRLKAKEFTPKDAPIVAKDGEFLSYQDEFNKTSVGDEYNVSNNLHKYIEYASGELGNPVRRRDKNFIESPDVDELVLAILEFDIRGIVNAISKMPKFNDGSAEKPFVGKNDLRARILLDTYKLGQAKKVYGVIEINIPKGFYINGNFVDESKKPYFVLKENKDVANNIKSYHFYQPMAIGVEKDGISKRVLAGVSLFPFEVERANIDKDMYIGGDFYFELCNAKGMCEPYKTEHGIWLRSSQDDAHSIYYNYVTQAHTHIPNTKIKEAKLQDIYYDKKNKKLDVVIETDKKFSNVAVMVEDANKTSFINPRYQIRDNFIVASFDVNLDNEDVKIDEVGVSASFDDNKAFRTKSNVVEDDKFRFIKISYSFNSLFWLGLLLNLLPGVFYLIIRNISLISDNTDGIKVYFRFVFNFVFVAILFGLVNLLFGINKGIIYFFLLAVMIETSFIMQYLGYMNFLLFRPFKKLLKNGAVLGGFAGVVLFGLPYIGVDLFGIIWQTSDIAYRTELFSGFVLGFIAPSFVGILLRLKGIKTNLNLKAFNMLYSLVYVLICLWFIFVNYGILCLVITLLCLVGLVNIWYNYPIYVGNLIKGDIKTDFYRQLFLKTQYKTLLILSLIYCILCFGIKLGQKQKDYIFDEVKVNKVIEDTVKDRGAILVGVVSKWSIKYLLDRVILQKHENLGLDILFVDAFNEIKSAKYWQDRYDKQTIPLYVLFTNRHKNGLVLPDSIGDINFFKAIKNL